METGLTILAASIPALRILLIRLRSSYQASEDPSSSYYGEAITLQAQKEDSRARSEIGEQGIQVTRQVSVNEDVASVRLSEWLIWPGRLPWFFIDTGQEIPTECHPVCGPCIASSGRGTRDLSRSGLHGAGSYPFLFRWSRDSSRGRYDMYRGETVLV